MSETCVHHGENHDPHCPFCRVIEQATEIAGLTGKLEKFYQWFRNMSRDQVDAMLEKMP